MTNAEAILLHFVRRATSVKSTSEHAEPGYLYLCVKVKTTFTESADWEAAALKIARRAQRGP